MSRVVAKPLEILCGRSGVSLPFQMERIQAGRNSEVWRLFSVDGQWILKNYFQDDSDGRDRLGTEYRFLTFLSNGGIRRVAKPLGIDRAAHRAIYSFLIGRRPTAITSSHITEAVAFIADINERRNESEALALPKASEACFSVQDHLDLIEARLSRWMKTRPQAGVHADAHVFMKEKVCPCWGRIRDRLQQGSTQLATPLSPEARVISPSDFGFHNTLDADGTLSFLDFEYAGWDDPAKLICDFICEPELPVSDSQGRQFKVELLRNLPSPDAIERRVDDLLPVHRVKWISILLNEFRAADRLRRIHAGVESDGLLADQLNKAKHYFNLHLALLN